MWLSRSTLSSVLAFLHGLKWSRSARGMCGIGDGSLVVSILFPDGRGPLGARVLETIIGLE